MKNRVACLRQRNDAHKPLPFVDCQCARVAPIGRCAPPREPHLERECLDEVEIEIENDDGMGRRIDEVWPAIIEDGLGMSSVRGRRVWEDRLGKRQGHLPVNNRDSKMSIRDGDSMDDVLG